MKYAIIEDDTIINIIEANDNFIENQKLNVLNIDDLEIHIGAKLIDGKWINLKIIEEINETISQ